MSIVEASREVRQGVKRVPGIGFGRGGSQASGRGGWGTGRGGMRGSGEGRGTCSALGLRTGDSLLEGRDLGAEGSDGGVEALNFRGRNLGLRRREEGSCL